MYHKVSMRVDHMSERLRRAVDATREELVEAIAEAEAELVNLQAREQEVMALIGEARRLLGNADGLSLAGSIVPERPRTLHDAMQLVLRASGEDGLTGRELKNAINQQKLYRRRDGAPVEVNQIHARANNYPRMFEKRGGRIRLRAERRAK
jgi:hypothetical protein